MYKSIRKESLFKMVSGSLYDLPVSSNLSYFWNFGSLLGLFFFLQMLSGIFLSFHYSCEDSISFYSIVHIMRDVNLGWFVRLMHANGASFFFLLLYFHMGRGLYYGSYRLINVWMSGVSLYLLSMIIAFLGYVLPWGQMSYWAATVITNLVTAVPYVGVFVVEWLWGGFSVGNWTLVRFFSLHFLFPFFLLMFILFHFYFLHNVGSSNFLGVNGNVDSVEFSPYYIYKDIMGFLFIGVVYFLMVCEYSYIFMDCDNFVEKNPMVTPNHIQPEWYFLFAYAILRSISSKVGGVVALILSVMLLYFLPFFVWNSCQGFSMYMLSRVFFWVFVFNWVLLTWLGSCEVEEPFSSISCVISFLYFLCYFVLYIVVVLENFIGE